MSLRSYQFRPVAPAQGPGHGSKRKSCGKSAWFREKGDPHCTRPRVLLLLLGRETATDVSRHGMPHILRSLEPRSSPLQHVILLPSCRTFPCSHRSNNVFSCLGAPVSPDGRRSASSPVRDLSHALPQGDFPRPTPIQNQKQDPAPRTLLRGIKEESKKNSASGQQKAPVKDQRRSNYISDPGQILISPYREQCQEGFSSRMSRLTLLSLITSPAEKHTPLLLFLQRGQGTKITQQSTKAKQNTIL